MVTVPEPAGGPLPPDAVQRQLQTILASDLFSNSPRLSRFLRYVVEQTLAGNAGDLKEYRIALDVFDRPETYDPKVDPVVRVDARQLRFKLAAYYDSAGLSDPVLICVPKGAYAARFEPRLAPAHQESAVTDQSPSPADHLEEAELLAPSDVPPELVPARSRLWAKATLVLAVILAAIAAGYFGAGWNRIGPVEAPSIAVLPFANLSGDPANEYFTDGLTDEITDALAHTKPLRVIARSSAFQFKGRNVDARQTGRELNVSSILTGSVARGGGRIKVLAQLARVSDGSVEWSRRYEQPESDLFALQFALASDIAVSLRVKLLPTAARQATRDPQAQDYFMRARYEADQLTRDSLLQSIDNYSRAIERDPGYAAAWYGLAVARHRLPAFANDMRLFDRKAIEQGYQKAIELDPNFPEPHTGLALLAAQVDWDWGRAERELETASAIAPNAMAEGHFALIELIQGRKAAAAEHIRKARDLDPLGVTILMNTAELQIMAGDYEAAREVLDRFTAQHPDVENARLWAAISLLFEGKADQALVRFRALEGNPETEIYEAAAYAAVGHRDEALRLLGSYQKRAVRSEASIAQVYGYLHDENNTLAWLDKSVTRRETASIYLAVHPAFKFLKENPKFREIERRVGLLP